MVRNDLTEDGEPFGCFVTAIENGEDKALHVPSGECLKWAYRKWTLLNTAEKILATTLGMLRPKRHVRRPDPD